MAYMQYPHPLVGIFQLVSQFKTLSQCLQDVKSGSRHATQSQEVMKDKVSRAHCFNHTSDQQILRNVETGE